jgi:hypothetical protein
MEWREVLQFGGEVEFVGDRVDQLLEVGEDGVFGGVRGEVEHGGYNKEK